MLTGIKDRLHAANERQEASRLTAGLSVAEVAKAIADEIRASAPPCPYEIHPVACWRCIKHRQAEADAQLAERKGGLR